nr:MAG TPA: hypothetical protein [Caudoviricetes sp.]
MKSAGIDIRLVIHLRMVILEPSGSISQKKNMMKKVIIILRVLIEAEKKKLNPGLRAQTRKQ